MEDKLIKKINQYFHDEEAVLYQGRHKVRIKNESLFYKDLFKEIFEKRKKSMKILDIGTGTGLVASALSGHGHYFLCTDISYNMLDRARKNLRMRSGTLFEFTLCDAEALPFKPAVFDLITCNAAMHHFPSIDKFALELDRVLASNGMLVISFEVNRKFWTNKVLNRLYRVAARVKGLFEQNNSGYNTICRNVNERLVKENVVKKPLSNIEMLKSVDIHSPNAGEMIDYSKGFDIDDLINKVFKHYRAKVLYHYDTEIKPFDIFNKLFFSQFAPEFSLILEKKT